MKVYELKLKKGGKGVFRISLVKDPAVEETLMKFNKESDEILTFADEEKRIIYAVAMRPNIEIFRKDVNGEPANVTYSKEFVEEAQINYFRNNGNKESNVNHDDESVDGVFPFTSWIVDDAKKDKAAVMGLDVIEGDLVMGFKIDNDDIWESIKDGDLDGLSVEMTNLDRILKTDIKMNKQADKKKGVLAFIKEGLNSLFDDAEKMELHPDEEEEKKDEADMVEDEKPEDEKPEDEKPEDEKPEDEKPEDEKPEDEKPEDEKPEDEEPTEKEKELMSEIVDLKQEIAELKADKIKDDEDLETMKSEVLKMKKKTPGAQKIPKGPKIIKQEKEKKYSEMSNLEKLKFNREK